MFNSQVLQWNVSRLIELKVEMILHRGHVFLFMVEGSRNRYKKVSGSIFNHLIESHSGL
jgi:hypothetical protein